MMGKGYMGKILTVDLTAGDIKEEIIPDDVYEKYLSGMGLAAYILYNRIPAGADPLGPDNILGFVSGLLTGTGSLFAGRWMVVGKSPLTGGWGDANCGGNFSPAIKRCGYDGIFFKGISSKPVYLYIENGKARLRDASHVWGRDTVEAEKMLLEDAPAGARVALIGPSGEKLSLISGICNDGGRMAARSGLGAVMGAKRLKALVLAGAKRIPVHNREGIKKLSRKCNKWVQFQPPFVPGSMMPYIGAFMRVMPTVLAQDGILYKIFLRKWGTGSMNQMSIEMGDSPIKNWKGNNEDFGPKKSVTTRPDVFTDREMIKYHCYSCPLGCGGICSMTGKYSETHKPEYETVLALGGLCMNEDVDSIFHLNETLNRAGMDTISAGGTVAFAIECYEEGILTKKDTDGLELSWGNSDAIIALIDKMVSREGVGDILADGSRIAARKLGKEAERLTIHAGGQELAMHDGRNDPGFALHYSVEPTPGRHTIGSGLYYEMFQLWKKVKGLPKVGLLYFKGSKYVVDEEKAVRGAACSKFMNVLNGAGLCMFGSFLGTKKIPTFEWLTEATGWNKTPEEYMEIGERIQTLRQAFNVKHGIEPKDFKLSGRAVGMPPLSGGANKGRTVDIDKMMESYWGQFGWDTRTGKPGSECMARLDIEAQ
ncbi:MAG: aldehyde ferredoxin oxidoreductase family protein [Deltaproteobacteria bacterium]|nr:aldehyde ferredoxin oxidoreductase family protein [Deltaproteobacteria bacterium]MBW2594568.1 aldehyde ferredoxin oxidoreductase family protein [Deltaproteobacteria bacterium]